MAGDTVVIYGQFLSSIVGIPARLSGLRKIKGSPQVSNHEILGFSLAQRQKLVACGTRALVELNPNQQQGWQQTLHWALTSSETDFADLWFDHIEEFFLQRSSDQNVFSAC